MADFVPKHTPFECGFHLSVVRKQCQLWVYPKFLAISALNYVSKGLKTFNHFVAGSPNLFSMASAWTSN